MIKSTIARWVVGAVVVIAVLGLIRFKPWQRSGTDRITSRQELKVGFLPVT
ncbi:MAG TPA: hypothetical protein VFV34_19010 [Blastocatellia bacterium]|nr:hypothetical protein [Blastocatellia bacterium]